MQNRTSGAKPPRQKRIDWDGAWKKAIQQLFPAFLALVFPEEHTLIDWTHEPVFLEQELRHVTRRVKRGKGAVDKLARVWLLDGSQTTLLVHMEFQHQVDPDLPKRLYTYNTRIYSLLQEQVMSVVVLGDDDSNWRPGEFGDHIYHGNYITLSKTIHRQRKEGGPAGGATRGPAGVSSRCARGAFQPGAGLYN